MLQWLINFRWLNIEVIIGIVKVSCLTCGMFSVETSSICAVVAVLVFCLLFYDTAKKLKHWTLS